MRAIFFSRSHRRTTSSVPAVVVLVLMLGACSGEVRPEVAVGIDACANCNMVIDTPNQACGYVADGEFVSFDSPACLLRSLRTPVRCRACSTGVCSAVRSLSRCS